jgi:predicted RNA binding protein YcfA (HicA-like mRNA interferase family)
MPAWGPVSRRVLIQTLRALGFEGPFPRRRHMIMQRGTVWATIPNPHTGAIGVGLLIRILREAEITREEWESV